MNEAGSARWIHLAGAGALAGWVVLAVASHRVGRPLPVFLAVLAWEWTLLLLAWRALGGVEAARARRAVMVWTGAFLVCGAFATPVMEDDQFRFLWDGWQFATTGNPYTAAPAEFFRDTNVPEKLQEVLSQINYPHVPTIYGPVCEAGFLVSYWIAPGELWPWKLLVSATALALVWVVAQAAGLGRVREPGRSRRGEAHSLREKDQSLLTSAPAKRGEDPSTVVRAALLIGWCPLLIFEAGFNAHPDVLGVLALAAALLARLRGSGVVCGVCCGLAVAAKVFALPLAPFLLWRSRAAWLGAAAAVLVIYAPFWRQGSGAEFAGLARFASEWEFNSSLFGVARWALGAPAAKGVCGALFMAAWVWLFLCWRRRVGNAGWEMPPGAAVFGTLLLCSATVNPWYLLWLAPFVAWRPTAAGVAALALVSLSYLTGLNLGWPTLDSFAHPWWVRLLEYGGLLAAAVVGWRWRNHGTVPVQQGAPSSCSAR